MKLDEDRPPSERISMEVTRTSIDSRPSLEIEQSHLTVVHQDPSQDIGALSEKKKTLWYMMTVEEVQQELCISSLDTGLTLQEAEGRLKHYGPNELRAKKSRIPLWLQILIRHSCNFMMLILAIAAILAFVLQEWIDAGVVCFVILLNIAIGFIQEFRSEQSMSKLQQMTTPTCRVLREGDLIEIESSKLVPGDIIAIKMGDQIPADVRLIRSSDLECNEALLTGESTNVSKHIREITNQGQEASDIPVGDRKNIAFMSTAVAKGNGRGIVIGTGMKTEIGKIAKSLGKKKNNNSTELQKRLSKLSLALLCVSICSVGIVLLAVGLYGRVPLYPEGMKYAITIAVSIIPESLMSVLTLTIGLGVRQMAKSNAIIRKLTALETLGSLTDICSDKTGTLTEGKMFVNKLMLPGGHSYSVTRIEDVKQEEEEAQQVALEYDIDVVVDDKNLENPSRESRSSITGTLLTFGGYEVKHLPSGVRMLIHVAALCNTSSVRFHQIGEHVSTGDPTEIALSVLTYTVDMSKNDLEQYMYPKMLKEFPFDSSIKRMTVIYESMTDKDHLFVMTKGAVDRVLPLCNKFLQDHDPSGKRRGDHTSEQEITQDVLTQIRQDNDDLAEQGMRVLCLTFKKIARADYNENITREQLENNLVFLGLAGIQDPPRAGVAEAVKTCHNAGIKVRMVTGDHPSTAKAIAKQIGIIPEEEQEGMVMKATDFDALTAEQLANLKELPVVIARCSPQTKVKLVDALHARKFGDKRVVVMTGDGVNDAPAITRSDVGVAMGKAGSDVTKESSDIVLADDNFVTIVRAVRKGRRIGDNIRKFLTFLLCGNAAQALILVVPVLAGLYLPMNPIQVLWLNIVISAAFAIALGVEPASKSIMNVKKRRVKEPTFSFETIFDIFVYGVIMACIVLVVYFCMTIWWLQRDVTITQSTCATTLAFITIAHSYNCRNARKSMFRNHPWRSYALHVAVIFAIASQCATLYIPWVNYQIFHQTGLAEEWGFVGSGFIIYVIAVELYKLVKRWFIKLIGKRIKNKYYSWKRSRAGALGTSQNPTEEQATYGQEDINVEVINA